MNIKIQTVVPHAIITCLQKMHLKYTALLCIYHCIDMGDNRWAGVAGDGDNGSYEWFIWRDGQLQTSNVGYGNTESALRDALIKEAA